MEIKSTGIDNLIELQPAVFGDDRGNFFESYQKRVLKENGIDTEFVQSNQSFSTKGVVRGLHLQRPPHDQAKLVRVISGRVLDVVVDLRKNSATYKQTYKCLLDGTKNNMLFVPKGFAHGFACLEDAIFFYSCDNYYNPKFESGIRWNDKFLNIDWEIKNPVVSEKDQLLPTFEEFLEISSL